MSNQQDFQSIAFHGLIEVAKGDKLDIRIKTDTGTGDMTMQAMMFDVRRVSELRAVR